jgi:type IV pilus assembly protein PilY1
MYRCFALALSTLLLAAPGAVRAQGDLDLFQTAVAPNVLIMMDSSGSMQTEVTPGVQRIEAARDAMTELVNEVNPDLAGGGYDLNVRFGIARFNGSTGAQILEPVYASKSAILSAIAGVPASGSTPLSESYLDGVRYLAGSNGIGPFSALSSMPGTSTSYLDPIDEFCRRSFVVVMTDGQPCRDLNPTWQTHPTPDFDGDGHANEPNDSCSDPALASDWLDDITKFAYETDIVDDATMTGIQNIATYTVGFAIDHPLLSDAADPNHGRGVYFTTGDADVLASQLRQILQDIVERSTSLTAATVPSSRTAFGDGFYTAFFRPSATDPFWQGHLQAFRLDTDLTVLNVHGNPAIDTVTNQFFEPREPFWDVADRLLDSGHPSRSLYTTDLSGTPARAGFDTHATATNLDVTAGDLTTYPDDPATDLPFATADALATAIRSYLRGFDAFDRDGDDDTSEKRDSVLGDIFHSSPIAIGPPPAALLSEDGYGPPSDATTFLGLYKTRDRVLYFGGNDGMLHGVNGGSFNTGDNPGTTAIENGYYDMGNGNERFAYVPGQLLDRVKHIPVNLPRQHYYVDGSPNAADAWLASSPSDTSKDPEEWTTVLVTGMRQGGSGYIALDVTDPTAISGPHGPYPKLLWEVYNDPTDSRPHASVEFGETWSDPILTRVKTRGASGIGDLCGDDDGDGDCVERWVAIISGGYDAEGDPNGASYVSNPADSQWTDAGKGVFVIALDTGELLAKLQHDAADSTFSLMRYAIPSTPAVLDLDFDGFADVIYVGDLGGQVWKWDIRGVGEDGDSDGLFDPSSWPAGLFFQSPPASMTAGGLHYHSIFFPPAATYIDDDLYLAFASGERTDILYEGVAGDDDNNRIWVARDLEPTGSSAFDYVLHEDHVTTASGTRGLSLLASTDAQDSTADDDGYYIVVPDGQKFISNHLIFGGLFLSLAYQPDTSGTVCAAAGQTLFYGFGVQKGAGVVDDTAPEVRSAVVGNGAPTDPRVSVSDGKVELIGQTSLGEVIKLPVPVDPPAPVELVYWRQRF